MPDWIDDALPTDQQLDDAEDSGDAAGKGVDDYQDKDQDAKDKAKNLTNDTETMLDELGNATGIDELNDAADAIDDATDEIFGPDLPPEVGLPPVHVRLYFGKKEMLDSLKDNLIGDAMGAADDLAGLGLSKAKEALGQDIPVLGAFGEDPFTSFYAEQKKEKDEDESHWIVRTARLTEGLNECYRLELECVRNEVRSPNEPPLNQANADGGLIDKIRSAVAMGQGLVQQGQQMVQQAQNVVGALGQVDNVDDLKNIANGLMGGGPAAGPDGPQPEINIPLDPKLFLNQLLSVAISRDLGDQTSKRRWPDIYRYPWVKRWVTGVITEFQDLGVARPPPPPPPPPQIIPGLGGLTRLPIAPTVLDPSAEGFMRTIKITVEPSLAKLRLRKNHRIWTDYNAVQIVQDVLREAAIYGLLPAIPGMSAVTDGLTEVLDGIPIAGDAISNTVSGQQIKFVPPAGVPVTEWTPKREYCCQFGETDLDFVKRLLEEEGITFVFHSVRGEERLVLVDDVGRFPEVATIDGRAIPSVYAFDSAPPGKLESVSSVRQRARLRSTRVTLRDFNFSNQALRPDRIEKNVGGKPQTPLANPPLPINTATLMAAAAGAITLPATIVPTPPDASSGLPGALEGGVATGQRFGTAGATSATGTDGTELEQYTWPARAVYQYEKEPEKPNPDEARHYKVYDPTAAPPDKTFVLNDADSPDRDLVRLRLEALIAPSQTMWLVSDVVSAMPGSILLLRGHWLFTNPDTPAAQQTQRLLVRRVTTVAGDPTSAAIKPVADEQFLADASFQNFIEVQWLDPDDPTKTPYRPPNFTRRPVVNGVQTATVVDVSMDDPEDVEQQIHSDHRKLGRVMVRFHWDRRGENPLGINVPFDIQGVSRGHTAWIRVAQAWAGEDFGVSFVPRVGMEVVIAFEDGNPDRPLIIGAVYNGAEVPPLDFDKKEQTHSIVRTRPNPYDDKAKEGTPAYNELRFVDDRYTEKVQLDARKYLVEEVRHDMWTRVVNDQKNDVLGNHGEIVLNYQKLEVSGNREKKVGIVELVEVGGNRVAEVHGNESLEIKWAREQKIEGPQIVNIGSPEAAKEKRRTLTVNGTRETHIGDPLDPEIGPCNDIFQIEGDEDIQVTGTLKVLAGSFGVGMPAAPGSPVQAGGMSVKNEEELDEQKDTLGVRSDKNETLEAKGEIAFESEHCGSTVSAGEKIEVISGENKMVLDGTSAVGPFTIESATKVVIECARSKIEMTADHVLVSAAGSPAAEMVFNAGGVGMKGGSLALIARNEIEISGGAIKV